MHHRDEAAYHFFCHILCKNPKADRIAVIAYVMQQSGGCADPGMIQDWYTQYEIWDGYYEGGAPFKYVE